MKITKHFLKEVLKETIVEFNDKVTSIGNVVEIEFIEKNEFMEDVKKNPLIQQQIRLGFYKNIDKEYVNFLVVYEKNKNPLLNLLGLPYKISICFELAKDILKPYPKNDVKSYLKHVYSHEIGHIIEKEAIKSRKELWLKCLQETNQDESLAMELFVESIADMVSDTKAYKKIEEDIWSDVKHRIKTITTNK